ncbi:MAG: serine hydrolase, partial [Candidatus Neomarinimicrobiota bacterium]
GINGFSTRIFRLIDDKHLVVVFNNTGTTDTRGICMAITNILYDMPYELPKISIAETLGETILNSDVESAIEQYHELKSNKENEYNFVESQLNILGYQLLGMDRVKDAIEIFKLNIEEYPEAFNPYDSLGEAYMIDGQNDLAIKNYAKSLEINPKNTGAINMLGKIIQAK